MKAIVPWFLLLAHCSLFDKDAREQTLGGSVPNYYDVPALAPAPVQRPDDTWMSVPTRSSDGTVFGVLQTEATMALVRVEEHGGRELWRRELPDFLKDFRRADGWRHDEVFAEMPITLEGGDLYLVAWQRELALVRRANGELVHSVRFPASVPVVLAKSGACFVDGKFWIGVDDGGRGGGVWLDAAGTLQAARVERPAGCAAVTPNEVASASPMQNARDSASEYPAGVCGTYSKTQHRRVGNRYCKDKRSDGGPEREVMLMIGDLVVRDGKDWTKIRFPRNLEGSPPAPDFAPWIVGIELGGDEVFLDQVESYGFVVDKAPAADSFEPDRSEQQSLEIELVSAIGREGTLRWTRALRRRRVAAPRVLRDAMMAWRSTLLASHPASPTQNLYVLKPGMLLALDQASGEPLWQIGKPLEK